MPIVNRTLPVAEWLMLQFTNKLLKEEQDIKTKGTKLYFKDKGNQAVRVVGENIPYFIPGSQAYMGLKAVDDFQNGNNVGGAVNTAFAVMPFAGNVLNKVGKHIKPKLTEYVTGGEAVKMFKEYGGTPIPEGSINGELLRKYVAEAREKYGLLGNTNITDEEIAQALYKHVRELGGNTAAVNALGESLLLFRGDTKRYTQLKPRMMPDEVAEKSGTMDNSLGTLFLGELPFTDGGDAGLLKYLNTGAYAYSKDGTLIAASWRPSLTGGSSIKIGDKIYQGWKNTPNMIDEPSIANIPDGAVLVDPGSPTQSGLVTKKFKLPIDITDAEALDINAFIVRTPNVHNMTNEMQVLAQNEATNPDLFGNEFHWLIKDKPEFFYSEYEGFPMLRYKGKEYENLGNSPEARELWKDQYNALLNEAKKENAGLLLSNPNGWLRREHPGYTYFALPNFNIRNAKHILPFDLRIPRDWNDPNIRRVIVGGAVGTGAASLLNNSQNNIQMLKQGGKLIKKRNK